MLKKTFASITFKRSFCQKRSDHFCADSKRFQDGVDTPYLALGLPHTSLFLPRVFPRDIAGHQLSTHIREGELTSQEMNPGIASFPFLPTGQTVIRCRLYDFLEDGPQD